MHATILLTALALTAAAPAPAGDATGGAPSIRAMTLPDALAYAREHQPSLQAAIARLQAAQEFTGVPRGLWYPRLGATAQILTGSADNTTASYFGSPVVDLPRIGGTAIDTESWHPYPSTLVAGGVRQEIFDFGKIAALSAIADSQLQAERGRSDLARLDVVFAVKEAFFAVQAAHGVLTAAQSALERARVNQQLAAAGVHAGLRSPIELTRADAELARFELGTVRARGALADAQATFAAIVSVPELALEAAGDAPPVSPAPPLAGALTDALARDPAVQVGRARLAEQQAQTTAIQAELRPEIMASATLSGREGAAPPSNGAPAQSGLGPRTPNWDVGLILSWPIYDQSVHARARTSARLERARRSELDDLEARLRSTVQEAYVAFDTAAQAVPALEKAVEAGRANYDQANARFKAGLGTSVELADAQDLLANAEVQLALGRFQYARTRVRLGRVIAEEP